MAEGVFIVLFATAGRYLRLLTTYLGAGDGDGT
jgi:hypothetical protein